MHRPAAGFMKSEHAMPRISIALDPDTFAVVRRRAAAAGTSFAEEARLLIETGIETMEADECP